MPMSEFVTKVKKGLSKLKEVDPNFEFDCSSYHLYELNPVVDEDDILDFEEENGCRLPEKYREFLTQLGNGGAGPSYGILPLGEDYDGQWPEYIKPGQPFPFTQAHNDTSILTNGKTELNTYTSAQNHQEASEQWLDEHREALFTSYCEAHMLNGAIPIVDHGCALSCWLVVSESPEYGHIWEDRVADEEGVYPYKGKNQTRYTFDQWYLEWIENALAGRLL